MLTLDQVKLLEDKVESLILMVKSLYGDRDALREALQKKDKEIEELSLKVASYETEQEKIEERVVNALNQLDVFQNSVASAKAILSKSDETTSGMSADSCETQSQVGIASETSNLPPHSNTEEVNQEYSIPSPNTSQNEHHKQLHQSDDQNESKQKEENEEDSDKQMDIF